MNDAAPREPFDTETDATGHGLRVPFSGDESPHASTEETPRPPAARRRLAKLVAAKLALDLLFVGAFALYTNAANFRRGFEGELEHADGRGASGWVVSLEKPGEDVEVQLFLNGRFAAAALAREPRTESAPDAAGEAGRRGFVFEFEQPRHGEYEARVYAVRTVRGEARRTLQLIGEPRHFWWK